MSETTKDILDTTNTEMKITITYSTPRLKDFLDTMSELDKFHETILSQLLKKTDLRNITHMA